MCIKNYPYFYHIIYLGKSYQDANYNDIDNTYSRNIKKFVPLPRLRMRKWNKRKPNYKSPSTYIDSNHDKYKQSYENINYELAKYDSPSGTYSYIPVPQEVSDTLSKEDGEYNAHHLLSHSYNY